MKKTVKVSAGLLLGAMLCLGILVSPQPADAYYWYCPGPPARILWCADYATDGINLYCNSGAWCHITHPCQDLCYYNLC